MSIQSSITIDEGIPCLSKVPLLSCVLNMARRHRTNIAEIYNESSSQYSTDNSAMSSQNNRHDDGFDIEYIIDDVTPNNGRICLYYLLFYTLWTGANYCYFRSCITATRRPL
eukprot:527461_1